MANSLIDTEMIVLTDNWPADPNPNWAGPYTGGPAVNSLLWEGQNTVAATYPLGRKFYLHEDGGTGKLSGWSTFIYLKLGTQHTSLNLSCVAGTNKCVCTVEGTLAESASAAATQIYLVTNDSDATTMEALGFAAVATSAMDDDYYGWFWCGGVAPLTMLTGLVGDCPTADSVALGDMAVAATDITHEPLGFAVASAGVASCGIATIADD